MKNLSLFCSFALILFVSSCRTTDVDKSRATEVQTDTLNGSLKLNQIESEKTYLRLLTMELAAGIKVPQESLHTSWGLLVCNQDGILKSCSLRARLIGDALSEGQNIDRLLTEKFWTFAKTSRPTLNSTKLIVADMVCDYVGPKSPPYTIEKVSCEIHHARETNEVVVADRMAEKIANSLRHDAMAADVSQLTLRGTVICRNTTKTPTCLTRGFKGDALSDRIREIDAATSRSLHRMMMRTFSDHADHNAKGRDVVFKEPEEVLGRIECLIDLNKPDVYGGHMCQIKL